MVLLINRTVDNIYFISIELIINLELVPKYILPVGSIRSESRLLVRCSDVKNKIYF